ncbi:MAG: alpha-L-arabinofuranosidase [Burkholderiales bacterium]|nr:alpha-L-arabinofuranosidase [Opitutaceae bacterium]
MSLPRHPAPRSRLSALGHWSLAIPALIAGLALLAALTPPLRADPNLIEAETILGTGDGLRADPTASGAAYAANPRDWNPVVIGTLPSTYTRLTLWALVRGGPFQLKGLVNGQQKELRWDRTKPATWAWVSFGAHDRSALGDKFLIISGQGLAPDSGIDALILSDDPSFRPTITPPAPASAPPRPSLPATPTALAGLLDLPPVGPLTAAYHAPDIATNGATIRPLPDAIRGTAVIQTRDYHTLAFAKLPPQGDPLSVYVRYRALALQFKVRKGDTQEELPWNWDRKDEAFGWRLAGTYSRAMLGEGLAVISAPNPPAHAGLDAIVITGDPALRPDGSVPLPGMPNAQDAVVIGNRPPAPESTAPGAATVSIDWRQPLAPVAPAIYGVNSFIAFKADRIGDPTYQKGLAYLAPRLVRLHHAGLTNDSVKDWAGWWDTAKNSWDYPKIRAALAAWPTTLPGTRRLFSFASWIPGMDLDKNNRLDPDKLDAYAAAAAELVRFMNIECRAGIEYFEITNEKDGSYWVDPAKRNEDYTADLVKIYNTVATAVHAIDPKLKLGGPAAMRPDFYANLRTFIQGTRAHLDFVSIHAYASGKNSEPDQSIYDKVEVMGKHARELVKIVREEFPTGPRPEVHLNEYNIAWTWETQEPRMVNHKGAVFDALALTTFATVDGLTAANAWNDQDGVYGKIAMDGTLRPSAHVFHLFNTFHQGERVAAESSAPGNVVAFATRDATGRPALTLINRVNGEQTVALESAPGSVLPANQRFALARIDATGFSRDERPSLLPPRIVLPPHSVTTFHPAE